MHIILGGTGHVGSAVAKALVEMGEPVTIVTRNATKARGAPDGAQVVTADAHDVDGLRRIFSQGTRLFLLNPPANPAGDTDAEERKTLHAILAALDGSGLEKIVAESTYGAQPGDQSGDLGILYEMEQGLKRQPIPATMIRAAYYMSNWDASLKTAKKDGVIHTLYPADFKLPMVAPDDVGQIAARLMIEPANRTGLYYVEGPEQYSAADVAAAFTYALNKPVKAEVTPREQWIQAFKAMGFSDVAARSYARMTAITLETPSFPDAPTRGETSLQSYVIELARNEDAA